MGAVILDKVVTGGAVVLLLTALGVYFWWWFRRMVQAQEATHGAVEKIDRKIDDLRLEVVRDYARKEDLQGERASHKEIWGEVNSIRERVAMVEATCTARHNDGRN